MRNATTAPAETQVLGEKGSDPFEGNVLKARTIDSFLALRATFSQCDSVYDGDLHWAIIVDRPCGTILADVDVGPQSRALATLFAAAPDLLTAAESAIGEIERAQMIIGATNDERFQAALAALRSAIDKACVRS